jgi:hypothetical protein
VASDTDLTDYPNYQEAATVTVDWEKLVHNHKDPDSIRGFVDFPDTYPTCTVTLCYAFNQSKEIVNAKPSETGFFYNNERYIQLVRTMRGYLDRKYGKAENYSGSKTLIQMVLGGRRGIIAFGNMHIDLWMGTDIHRPSLFRPVIWTDKSTIDNGIFFWEVP